MAGIPAEAPLAQLNTKLAARPDGIPYELDQVVKGLSEGSLHIAVESVEFDGIQGFLDSSVGAHIPESATSPLGFKDFKWKAVYHDDGRSPVGSVLFVGHEGEMPEDGEELLSGALGTIHVSFDHNSAAKTVSITGVYGGDPTSGYRIASAQYDGQGFRALKSVGLSFAEGEYSRTPDSGAHMFEYNDRYRNNTGPVVAGFSAPDAESKERRLPGVVTRDMIEVVSDRRGKEHTTCLVAVAPPLSSDQTNALWTIDNEIGRIERSIESIEDRSRLYDLRGWDTPRELIRGLVRDRSALARLRAERPSHIPQPNVPKVTFGNGHFSANSPTPFARVDRINGQIEVGVAPEPAKGKGRGDNARFSIIFPTMLEQAT